MASRNNKKRKGNGSPPAPPVAVKQCEWCGKGLPTVRYHLRICPDCRKTSISTFRKSLGR